MKLFPLIRRKIITYRYSFWVLVLLLFCINLTLCNPDAKRLYDDLLSNYNRLIRPVSNNTDTVLVKLGLRLSQLIELNLKDQILTTNVWLEHVSITKLTKLTHFQQIFCDCRSGRTTNSCGIPKNMGV